MTLAIGCWRLRRMNRRAPGAFLMVDMSRLYSVFNIENEIAYTSSTSGELKVCAQQERLAGPLRLDLTVSESFAS